MVSGTEFTNDYYKEHKCKKCDFAAICAYKGANERKIPKVKGLESFDTEGEKNE